MEKALKDYLSIWDTTKDGQIDLKQVDSVTSSMKEGKGKDFVKQLSRTSIGKEDALKAMMQNVPKEFSDKNSKAVEEIVALTAELKGLVAASKKGNTSASKKASKSEEGKGKGAVAASKKGNTSTSKKASAPEEGKGKTRRNKLLRIEKEMQKAWKDSKMNEPEVGDGKGEKYFCTFPYPYMNGKLHLGHAFTLCKAEFAARFHRLLGKKVLFPFGFHCTGMPIAACAEKLAKEISLYGNPPLFPEEDAVEKKVESEKPKAKKGGKKGGKKVKGKASNKKSTKKFQWQILEEMGVPSSEISKFTDAQHWLSYFPPLAIEDLSKLGVMVDWRRSFITTDRNPFYDAFVRWQFNRLREAKKVELAKRMCVFSPSNGQPCADHDRAEGEGVGPQEYTLIKIKVIPPFSEGLTKALPAGTKDVYLAAATLRPETMYGQTNCWILPSGEYSVVKMTSGELFVVSARSALNMSFQELSGTPNKPDIIGKVMGSDLLGLKLKAPLCKYDFVYTLPLLTISMGKGTGVVTSVPSDAPADYAAYIDMKKDAGMRKKYGVTEDMVKFDIVPIIDTPLEGASAEDRKLPAPYLCKKMKIKSQKAVDKLELAKKECYKISNAKGIMLVGEAKGKGVMEAKEEVKKMMIENKQAVTYYEPQEKVVARAGNEECVCALTEQWFLNYGEEKWKTEVEKHIVSTLNCYNPKAKSMFEFTINWLKQWACSRTAGLGTKLPWDHTFLIESLSDSTIYMAYYTIAHFFQGNTLDGGKIEKGNGRIMPEDLTDEVFSYIFADPDAKVSPPKSNISVDKLKKMREEFCFWYPMDLRVSGKDLIRNHLTMSLYNHAAIWQGNQSMWPRSFFTNGHVMLNSNKMSKSTGNFMTLEQAINEFGADASRLALAGAGDGLEDSNFESVTADKAILRLTTFDEWVNEQIELESKLRTGDQDSFFDKVFDNEMNSIVKGVLKAYKEMRFRDVTVLGFFGMLGARDWYRNYVPNGTHVELVKKFIKIQCILLAPICPHFFDYIWRKASSFIGVKGSVVKAKWPNTPKPDDALTAKIEYLRSLNSTIRSTLAKGKKKAKKVPDAVVLYVTTELPEWKKVVIGAYKKGYEEKGTMIEAKTLAMNLKASSIFKKNKRLFKTATNYGVLLSRQFKTIGAKVFELTLPFDEMQLLNESKSYLLTGTPFKRVIIKTFDPVEVEKMKGQKIVAEPGKPGISYIVDEK